MPMTFSGRRVVMANFMIGIEEVLVASTASGSTTMSSSWRNTAVLAASFSMMASTTNWRSASADISEVNRSRSRIAA